MTINTDMKIAILLPGQPRFTGDLDLFLSNLKGYSQADWFCYLSNNSSQVEQKSDSIKIHSSWIDYDIEWARAKIISNLPSGHQLQDFAVSDSESKTWPEVVQKGSFFSKPFPVFSMYYNIYKANQLREAYESQHNFKYDLVIRTRSDYGLSNEVDLSKYDRTSNTVFMPNNEWYGIGYPSNDQFAFGNSAVMSIYADLVNHLKEYDDRNVQFGPENMLGYHLSLNGIAHTPGGFTGVIRQQPLSSKWD
jgi:hypothetical protein